MGSISGSQLNLKLPLFLSFNRNQWTWCFTHTLRKPQECTNQECEWCHMTGLHYNPPSADPSCPWAGPRGRYGCRGQGAVPGRTSSLTSRMEMTPQLLHSICKWNSPIATHVTLNILQGEFTNFYPCHVRNFAGGIHQLHPFHVYYFASGCHQLLPMSHILFCKENSPTSSHVTCTILQVEFTNCTHFMCTILQVEFTNRYPCQVSYFAWRIRQLLPMSRAPFCKWNSPTAPISCVPFCKWNSPIATHVTCIILPGDSPTLTHVTCTTL